MFTSEHIAGFMCKLIDIHKDDRVLDAACGSGAFPIRAMSPLRQAGVFSFAFGSKSRSFAYNTKGQIRKWCAMQDVTLNVIDEERLYNPFDPQRTMLADEVKAYFLGELQIEGRMDGINLEVRSTTAIDEERLATGIQRWVEDEERSIKASRRMNVVQQIWMFGLGVLFIALSLLLQPMVDVVWFTVLSTIGAFSIWEAASIWIVQNPKLRLQAHVVSRLKEQLTLRFSVCAPENEER